MSLYAMPAGDLPAHVKSRILRDAESKMADGTDARLTIANSVLDHFAEQNALDAMEKINAAAETSSNIMIFGAPQPADAKTAFPDDLVNVEDGDITTAIMHGAASMFDFIRARLKGPADQPANRGKFLSRYGIVKSDIEAIAPATTTQKTEADFADAAVAVLPPEAPAFDIGAALSFDLNAALGLPAEMPAAPPPQVVVQDSAAIKQPVPNREPDTRKLFLLYGEALEDRRETIAGKLGISRTTLYNNMQGKMQKPKCDLAQARILLADIDVRMAKLTEAAEELRLVR